MSEVPDSPQTRTETYLAGALGQAVVLPEPVTRLEQYLKAIAESGGGGGGLMPVIIYAESHTTVETYEVPVLTDAQILAAYNGIMAGKVVVVVDDMDFIAMQVYDASNIDGTAIRLIFTDKMILNYKEGGEIEATLFAGGLAPVTSVNTKTGAVVLNASDILAQNSQSIQSNLERIDDELAIRQVTITIDEWPETLTDDFLYRIETAISHGGKTYETGLYQVVDGDLVIIGGGGSEETRVELTSADYDYPQSNPNGVALWNLPAGKYYVKGALLYYSAASSSAIYNFWGLIDIVDFSPINVRRLAFAYNYNTITVYELYDGGTEGHRVTVINSQNVANLLNVTGDGYVLDARQGKVLKDLIDSLVIKGAGAPTTSTVGTVGQLYEDTANGKLYQCTAVASGTYTWSELGGGGSGPTVVQGYGASTTDVISQKGVSDLISNNRFGYGNCIQIGTNAVATAANSIALLGSSTGGSSVAVGQNSASSSYYCTAVGYMAKAYAEGGVAIGQNATAPSGKIGSIALGAYANPTRTGEFNIGAVGQTGYGFNNTEYRLISGVHDGQSAHDAATYGQLQALEARIAALEGNA